jgi:DNA polymerase III sliding clamp (beta) subunit (PCNA family)
MKNKIQAIKTALQFAAKNDIRYYLNGVALYIQDGALLSVVGTDGHSMVVVGDHILNPVERDIAIVDRKDIPTLVNALSLGDTFQIDHLTLKIGESYSIPLIDGRYPDVRHYQPNKKRTVSIDSGICFNPEEVAKLEKARKEITTHLKASDRKKVTVKCHFAGPSDSGLFVLQYYGKDGSIDDCSVTIMPVRG